MYPIFDNNQGCNPRSLKVSRSQLTNRPYLFSISTSLTEENNRLND